MFKILEDTPYKTYKPKELARILKIPPYKYQHFKRYLKKLLADGKIYKYKKGRVGIGKKPTAVVGRLDIKTQGYGFLIQENDGKDIYISQSNMGTALNGDIVRVILFNHTTGKSYEGRVVEVIERVLKNIVGTYQAGKYWGTVVPDDLKLNRDILIPNNKNQNAKSGQKVVVRLDSWEDEHLNLDGKIVEILGFPEEPGVDITSLAKSYDLPTAFSSKILQEAEAISDQLEKNEFQKRVDLREELCFTIDPEDSNDFDDAVSLKILENGNYLLGVHIADVSYYVKPNMALNQEAIDRGTSVYLVDRVIPMLPEYLSNEICCLKPKQDKLCVSVIMELSPEGELIRYKIVESVICSKKRFTYQEVQQIIDNSKKSKKFSVAILNMHQLSKQLIRKRKKRGGLDFGSKEIKIELDKKGVPVKIDRTIQLDSHRIIEEFMVLANNTVAHHINIHLKKQGHNSLPFAYRVHEKPNSEKIKDFKKFLAALAIDFPIKKKVTPKMFQQLLQNIKNTDKEILVEDVMVRTMMKAKYNVKSTGHFGLALKNYCHFTSPIRRYPDLICHRLLKGYLLNQNQIQITEKELAKICQTATEREILAMEVERASIKAKKLEFMEHHIGEIYDGIISGVTSFGIFVEITENLVEGLIHITNLPTDYYNHDEQRFCLYGQSNGKIYQLGNLIKVRVVHVNHEAKVIDFELVENNN